MSKPGSESPKPEWAARLERDGFATDIRLIPGRPEFVGVRDITLAWAIVHCYMPSRGGPVVIARWDYGSYDAAKAALDAWTPGRQKEPSGWTAVAGIGQGGDEGRSGTLKSISTRRRS